MYIYMSACVIVNVNELVNQGCLRTTWHHSGISGFYVVGCNLYHFHLVHLDENISSAFTLIPKKTTIPLKIPNSLAIRVK